MENKEEKQNKAEDSVVDSSIFYQKMEPIEPYLGLAWAFTLFIIYLIIYLFPVERFSIMWYFEIYLVTLLAAITIFAIYKRIKYNIDRKNN